MTWRESSKIRKGSCVSFLSDTKIGSFESCGLPTVNWGWSLRFGGLFSFLRESCLDALE